MKSDSGAENAPSVPIDARSRTQPVTEPLPAALPNGGIIFVRPEIIDPSGNVGILDLDFLQVGTALKGLAEVICDGFKEAKPSKTSMELGIELGLKSGKLAAILVNGGGTASIKVKLEWDNEGK